MGEKLRLFFLVLRAVWRDRQFFEEGRTLAVETRENRGKIEALRAELQQLAALIQQVVQEFKIMRQELDEAREYNEQERQKIRQRLEQIEQGLPFETRTQDDAGSGWVM